MSHFNRPARKQKTLQSLQDNPSLKPSGADVDQSPLIRHWVASVLSQPHIWKEACGYADDFSHPELLAYLGLDLSRIRKRKTPPPELLSFVRDIDVCFETNLVYRNLLDLGRKLSLTEAEMRLLTLAVHSRSHNLVNSLVELVPISHRLVLPGLLSPLTGCDEESIRQALLPSGSLITTGLLQDGSFGYRHSSLGDCLSASDSILPFVWESDATDQLQKLFYETGGESELQEDDYSSVAPHIEVISALIGNAVDSNRKGANVLIHGQPGSGKTQLAHLLAQKLALDLVIVPELDVDGDSLSPWERLGRLNACQRMLRHQDGVMVLFDECEEALSTEWFRKQVSKASLARALEDNQHPVLWICNDATEIEDALLRRFDYVLRLDLPGESQRQGIAQKYLGHLPVSDDWINRVAGIQYLSPAILEAASKLGAVCQSAGLDTEKSLTLSLEERLDLAGSTQRLQAPADVRLPWRAEVLNADLDVATLISRFRPDAPARLCLFGPPGTGKTAWAEQLAKQLEKPLIIKRASDLLSCWVGNTEARIDRAFREAEKENAILLIDEVDGFLDSRRHALRSWEISHVNQFLSSMETFQGILVATTNLTDRLDPAAMRRFDAKVCFDYLTLDGACQMLRDLADVFSITVPGDEDLADMLMGLTQLAPGDFALIARRLHIIQDKPDVTGLVDLLRRETSFKSD